MRGRCLPPALIDSVPRLRSQRRLSRYAFRIKVFPNNQQPHKEEKHSSARDNRRRGFWEYLPASFTSEGGYGPLTASTTVVYH